LFTSLPPIAAPPRQGGPAVGNLGDRARPGTHLRSSCFDSPLRPDGRILHSG
jgi:hypothetical protein